MKKSILALLFAIVTFVTPFNGPTAVGAPLTTDRSVVVFHSDKEQTFAVGKDLFTFKNFTSTDKGTSGNFSVVEIAHAPRYRGFLLEKHAIDADENFYVLEGEFEFFGTRPNKAVKANSGDVVHIPAGTPYGLRNAGSELGRILLITTSKGSENFIEEIGTSVADKSSIPSDSVEPDIAKTASVAHQYGIEFFN